jgi:pyrimidine operon attenuation protein/uracil phosphoribosyltransferase
MPSRTPLLDERAMARTLARMASEIVERSGGTEELVLIGIQRRGVELAGRLKRLIDSAESSNLPCGKLDITLIVTISRLSVLVRLSARPVSQTWMGNRS